MDQVDQSLEQKMALIQLATQNRNKSVRNDFITPIKCAIYGRVSTTHVEQLNAFENQLDWYQMILKSHPNFQVIEIYSETASGTHVKNRKEFNRMIDDAIKGKFQLIITREVCRFARNTVDSLNYVRLLGQYNVEVYFVSDGIYSLDPDGELRLTIFSGLAQEEARKISERVRNGQKVSMAKGVLYGFNAFGYRHIKGETSEETRYEIDPDQAETIRMIFDLYLKGNMGLNAIVTELVASNRKNSQGIVKWDCTRVSRILDHKQYCGYLCYNQSYKQNFLTGRIINRDKSSYIYIRSDKMPQIISEEDFNRVQEIKAARRKNNTGRGQCRNISKERYIKKMVCSCGKTFKKYRWHVLEDNTPVFGYECRNKRDNRTRDFREKHGVETEGFCNQMSICQWKLDLMLESIVSELWENPQETVNKLMWMISCTDTEDEENVQKNERIETLKNEIGKAENRRETLEMKWLDGKMTDADHDRLCGTISKNIENYRMELEKLQSIVSSVPEGNDDLETKMKNIRQMEAILTSNSNLNALKLDDAFVDSFVARIVPCGRKFKWYVNIGSGRGWGFFNDDAYELYDYWSIGYETANRYRKARNQYLRKNQWEDLTIELYIRTK